MPTFFTCFLCTNRTYRWNPFCSNPLLKGRAVGCKVFCRFAIQTQAWSSPRVEGLRSNPQYAQMHQELHARL
jgi:hypothetical protein